MYGGSGIGINKFASDAEKKAAWKFITWATSPEIQLRILKKTGGTPTRNSVYNMEEVKQAAQASSEESQYPNVVPPSGRRGRTATSVSVRTSRSGRNSTRSSTRRSRR
ncbi:extracellular solute-binding protein [Halospeciosus flavus]|uniref:extracellular solute-binding protein n=1 Tax=Halospeciosus flavus TaxID=3032283 RepID=UPI003613920C